METALRNMWRSIHFDLYKWFGVTLTSIYPTTTHPIQFVGSMALTKIVCLFINVKRIDTKVFVPFFVYLCRAYHCYRLHSHRQLACETSLASINIVSKLHWRVKCAVLMPLEGIRFFLYRQKLSQMVDVANHAIMLMTSCRMSIKKKGEKKTFEYFLISIFSRSFAGTHLKRLRFFSAFFCQLLRAQENEREYREWG